MFHKSDGKANRGTVDKEKVISDVKRIVDLWKVNRKRIIKSRCKFPAEWRKDNYSSYLKFARRRVSYSMPPETFNKLSDEDVLRKFKKTWPGRSVTHYNNRIENGKVIRESFTKRLPKGKLSNMRGKIRDEVREALLLKPSSTCLLTGVAPFKYGSGPGKTSNQDTRLFGYLASKDIPKETFEKYDLYEQERVSVPGVWENQYLDIQECADQNPNRIKSYDKLIDAINTRFGGTLKLPNLDKPVSDDCLVVKTNGRAQSGVVSGKIFGRTHNEADRFMRPIAKKIFEISKDKTIYDTSIWSLGGRARRQQINKDAPLRGRIIMMPDGIPKIFGLTYASKIYDALGELNYGKFDNECQIGRNDFHGNYIKYWKYFSSNKMGINTLEADISKHDASTGEEVMVVAFGIIRSMFPPGEDIDKHFLYMMSGTITKNLIVPGRFIYRLTKSIPSGSPFTSILTTIVNWLNWSVLLETEFSEKARDFTMNLFGDDTIINLPDWCQKTEIWWVQKFKSICGYDLDPCEIRSFHASNWERRPSFLKTIPNNGLPARLTKDLFTSVSFVKPRNRSIWGYIRQVTIAAFSAPFNYEGINFVFGFRTWLYKHKFKVNEELYIFKNSHRRRGIEDRFSYKTLCKNYLYPCIYGYDYTKNVDLGNKPKDVSPGGNVAIYGLDSSFQYIFFGGIIN